MTVSENEVSEVIGVPIEKIDFSEFHPLDHHPWERRCGEFYGGRRNHLDLWWTYRRPRPIQSVRCRFGQHEWVEFWTGRPKPESVPDGLMCDHCLIKA